MLMFRKNNTCSTKSLLFTLCQMCVIVVNFHKASGKYSRFPKFYRSPEKLGVINTLRSSVGADSIKYLNIEDIVAINDDEYPEKELERIVEETKKIIQSHDKVLRKQIKIDESYDFLYLKGKNDKFFSSGKHVPFNPVKSSHFLELRSNLVSLSEWNDSQVREKSSSKDGSCSVKNTNWTTPRFLSNNHYVINTPNFEQAFVISKCEIENGACGSPYKNQVSSYKRVCVQDYKRIELIAFPAYKEFNVANQELLSMNVHNGCKCSLIRI